ncbi:SPP-like hydrolase [Halorubrum distributum JCM 9100]|uniref:Phosphoglycolate phosphatase n=4 Tax=Halorubrum distributum TaxID=29283 RepID=M0ETC8_9EURY|nr:MULTISPECIES: HAD-IIB family hydrolase [Halorubrum distributum group]ELZ35852.1 SPP-like hydrolase [Halorubrum terrestre JCM 10247]ELZ50950.1 SPP-like hydrolase [Halorubrum distributum JCM 9100]ELZ52952.1 SPP-like hydrolase [Halorubrum distributum JCM 10118]MYL66797.1 HAD-IIB family hydrolase [Halorubrum terrestre]
MVPPLALDIDGTLTTPDHRIDPRVFELLPAWDAPVVFATGKAFPYPVALAHFLGREETVIAENGGVAYADGETTVVGDPDAAWAVVEAFRERGGEIGWGDGDTVNRWRETEVAVSPDADEALLREVAAAVDDVEVVDTGYAYHVKSTGVSKGRALGVVADALDIDPAAFVAVGDSENDVSTFEVAGESYAVANADDAAREAADEVVGEGFMDGTVSVLERLRERAE